MAFPVSTHSCPTPVLEVVVLGVGAGASTTYSGECSSSFMICQDGLPVLMLDVVSAIQTLSLYGAQHKHTQQLRHTAPTHIFRLLPLPLRHNTGLGVSSSRAALGWQPASPHLRLAQPHGPRWRAASAVGC